MCSAAAEPLLVIAGLHGWYGELDVLHGMDIVVNRGEVVTLLGRNGAGKTTALKAIMGLLARRTGSIRLVGRELIDLQAQRIAQAGIAYCPEERGIFSILSVDENLTLPPVLRPGGMMTEEIYSLFPNIAERRRSQGTRLSGGEQQMLALGRILRTGARLLLLDEPTEGLAPVIVRQIGDLITTLKPRGYAILLVEQNLRFAAAMSDRHYLVEHGQVVDAIPAGRFIAGVERLQQHLGV